MNIQHQDDGKNGLFFIAENGKTLAEMAYKWSGPHQFTILHTEVDESLEGQGIGKQLVQKGVEFAREKGSKIVPRCTFANAVIHRTPAFQDVLNS
jgi:uncharacterized protein